MSQRTNTLVSIAICLAVPTAFLVRGLISTPDSVFLAPVWAAFALFVAIAKPLIFAAPWFLLPVFAYGVGRIISQAKRNLAPKTPGSPSLCGAASAILLVWVGYADLWDAARDGLAGLSVFHLMLIVFLSVFSAILFVMRKSLEGSKRRIASENVACIIMTIIFVGVTWLVQGVAAYETDRRIQREAQTAQIAADTAIFEARIREREATRKEAEAEAVRVQAQRERAQFDALVLVEKGTPAQITGEIAKDPSRQPMRSWLYADALTAENVSPTSGEIWVVIPKFGVHEPSVLRCVKEGGDAQWVPEPDNTALTAALKHRVCVQRAAEY